MHLLGVRPCAPGDAEMPTEQVSPQGNRRRAGCETVAGVQEGVPGGLQVVFAKASEMMILFILCGFRVLHSVWVERQDIPGDHLCP